MGILFAFATFIILATFPGWQDGEFQDGDSMSLKPFPHRFVAQSALALVFVATVFVLVSVLWQHTASVAAAQVAQDFGNGSVRSGVGTSAMVLGWFGFSLFMLVTISLVAYVLSISTLERFSESESSESSGTSGP